jgi:hypothetical protein
VLFASYPISLVLEVAFNMKILVTLLTIASFVAPVGITWIWPDKTHPALTALLGALQTGFGIWCGIVWTSQSISSKWLVQAVGACDRLLTVRSSVSSVHVDLSKRCGDVERDCPELKDPKLGAIRQAMKQSCSGDASRLNDIGHHLDGAVNDWVRFVQEECAGGECLRFGSQIDQRREALRRREPGCGEQCLTTASK